MADSSDAGSTINHLIETAQDGADGYHAAADDVKDASLKAVFSQYATERAGFVRELRALAPSVGGDADKGGSVAAAAHRGWINVKSVVTGRDDAAILAECQRGDEFAVKAYEDAAAAPLPAHVMSIVQREAAAVRAAYERVRGLKVATS